MREDYRSSKMPLGRQTKGSWITAPQIRVARHASGSTNSKLARMNPVGYKTRVGSESVQREAKRRNSAFDNPESRGTHNRQLSVKARRGYCRVQQDYKDAIRSHSDGRDWVLQALRTTNNAPSKGQNSSSSMRGDC